MNKGMTTVVSKIKNDTQIVELRGRNWLMNKLMQADLEFALPSRDRGIDLILYSDLDRVTKRFIALPIQMKAASHRVFSLNIKYKRFPGMLLVYVWHLDDPANTHTYALNYSEAYKIAVKMDWTKTGVWKKHGSYSTSNPGKRLQELLTPYKITSDKWRKRVLVR